MKNIRNKLIYFKLLIGTLCLTLLHFQVPVADSGDGPVRLSQEEIRLLQKADNYYMENYFSISYRAGMQSSLEREEWSRRVRVPAVYFPRIDQTIATDKLKTHAQSLFGFITQREPQFMERSLFRLMDDLPPEGPEPFNSQFISHFNSHFISHFNSHFNSLFNFSL